MAPKGGMIMKTRTAALGLLLAICMLGLAKDKKHNWETAKVVDQQLSSSLAGAYAAPIGTAAIAVPIYQQANDVLLETTGYRYALHEVGRKAVLGVTTTPQAPANPAGKQRHTVLPRG